MPYTGFGKLGLIALSGCRLFVVVHYASLSLALGRVHIYDWPGNN